MRIYPPRTQGNTSYNGQRDRATQHRFRLALIEKAGGLHCQPCAAHNREPEGEIQAHHLTEATGILVCQRCHREMDPYAR